MKTNIWVALLAWAFLGLAPAHAARQPDADLTGTWNGQLVLNSGDVDGITLVVRKAGPKPEGTVVDAMGILPAGTKLESASFLGRELKFKCRAQDNTGPVVVQITLVLRGNTLAGSWEDAQNGTSGAVELKKKKEGENR